MTAKKCPICSNDVKDFLINESEMLEMCTNTKCIHPFSKTGTMAIKSVDGKVNTEIVQEPTAPEYPTDTFNIQQFSTPTEYHPDSFDIQRFLDELTLTPNQTMTKEESDILSEFINSSEIFQDKG